MTAMADSPPLSSPDATTDAHRSIGWRFASAGSAGLLVSAAAAATAVLAGMGTAGAATIDVTNCDDTGAGSLRDAIATADASAGADTIVISATCTLANPVTLSSEMVVAAAGDDLSIVGPGSATFVLDGADSTRIMRFENVGDVSLSGITMRGGNGTGGTPDADGGALLINGAGDVRLADVVFDANNSLSAGGGLYTDNANSVTITGCTFSNNSAVDGGGAFYSLSNGDIVISNSTFVGNNSDSNGGAISVYENPGSFTMTNSTLTGNSSGLAGSAVFLRDLYGDATLLFNTITDNAAGYGVGVYIASTQDSLTVTMTGNVVSENSGTVVDYEVFIGGGWTVVTGSNDFHGTVVGLTPDASDVNVDPMLEVLADNGGPTWTRALAANSPLIDLGPATIPVFSGNGFDQRGTPFIREYNGRSDIGAFEWTPAPAPTTTQAVSPATDPDGPVVPTFTG
ncbi:MAG: hypothetical protein F2585_07590 [Actinobacteria bacterium]|nr:hypothetical protein [Actinomycetota bacterium]